MRIQKLKSLVVIGCLGSALSFAQQQDPSAACVREIENKPELQVLKSKITFTFNQSPTLEMLTNEKKVNKEEKAALAIYDETLTSCGELGKDWRLKNYPASLNITLNQILSEQKTMLVDLYGGKITYAAFLKNREQLKEKLNNVVAEITQKNALDKSIAEEREKQRRIQQAREDEARRIAAENDAQNRAEQDLQQRRAIAAQILMNQKPAQIYQPPIMRSTSQTNCNPNGMGGFKCTSN